MARGLPGAFGGKKINSYPVWLGFCARLPARARRLAAAALAAEPRPADAALVLGLALVLQPRRRLRRDAARLSGARVAARALLWIGRRDRAPRGSAVWPVWLLIGATVFLRRLPDRPQRARLERDRRRLLRRDRRRPDRARRRARTGTSRSRATGPRAAPPTRPARSATGSRRTAAARRRTRTATRTAPSPTRPTCPATASSAGAGSGTRCRPPTRRRSSGTCSASLGLALVGLAVRRARLGGDARVRLGRLAVHAVRRRARTRTT